MKKHKTFTLVVAAILSGYLLLNLSIWLLYSRKPGGDLTRMGYIRESRVPRQPVDDLPRRHVERDNYHGEKVDVITVGDSFSHGGGGGRNSHYQDYLASLNGLMVLNLPEFKGVDKVSSVILLNNSGYLDRTRPRYVLLECAEKLCLKEMPGSFDFDTQISERELDSLPTRNYHEQDAGKKEGFSLEFFTEANYKYLRYSVLYHFSDNAQVGQVYKVKLDRPFFSVSAADTLLFYYGDIKVREEMTTRNIQKLNDALNTLHDRLAAKGISLVFMPCVDKYDLYSKYIVNNKYPRSTFFEELRKLPKSYEFIDTKAILAGELEKGEPDIFYADDTHWSWKASEKIFRTVRFSGDGSQTATAQRGRPDTARR